MAIYYVRGGGEGGGELFMQKKIKKMEICVYTSLNVGD
jgi:hypothetical protein